jgi:D-alanyl-lipoteichoic acid acyltransferase DltB (MBOAT superfamily)
VSLGTWLRETIYLPLGGRRRHRARNVLIVFLASGAWHVWGTLKLLGFGYYPPRAWTGFLAWAGLHAAAVIAVGGAGGGRGARIATFLFAAFAWMPFFMPADVTPLELARVLVRMLVPIVP